MRLATPAAMIVCLLSAWLWAPLVQGQERGRASYSMDELVDLYVELALTLEGKVQSGNGGVLIKWAPDVSVRIFPQFGATFFGKYEVDPVIDEVKRVADSLGSLIEHPKITSFDRAALEEFVQQAQLDETNEVFENSVVVYIGTRADLVDRMTETRSDNPQFPEFLITLATEATVPFCGGWNAGDEKRSLGTALIFIDDTAGLTACLYEEIMQSFGLPQDFPDGTPSIFNDDNAFALPTELDLLFWRIHSDPRLKAGMREGEVRAIVPAIITDLLSLDGP